MTDLRGEREAFGSGSTQRQGEPRRPGVSPVRAIERVRLHADLVMLAYQYSSSVTDGMSRPRAVLALRGTRAPARGARPRVLALGRLVRHVREAKRERRRTGRPRRAHASAGAARFRQLEPVEVACGSLLKERPKTIEPLFPAGVVDGAAAIEIAETTPKNAATRLTVGPSRGRSPDAPCA